MDAVQTIRRGNLVLEIYHDDNPENPREWDNMSKMVCFHGRYNVPRELEIDESELDSWEEIEEFLVKEYKPSVILPIYMYDHGNVALSTQSFAGRAVHAYWDSGRIGFVMALPDDIKESFGITEITDEHIQRAERICKAEVETLSQWMSGDVYGFKLFEEKTCDHCGHTSRDEIDRCWGFYTDNWEENGMLDHLPSKFRNNS